MNERKPVSSDVFDPLSPCDSDDENNVDHSTVSRDDYHSHNHNEHNSDVCDTEYKTNMSNPNSLPSVSNYPSPSSSYLSSPPYPSSSSSPSSHCYDSNVVTTYLSNHPPIDYDDDNITPQTKKPILSLLKPDVNIVDYLNSDIVAALTIMLSYLVCLFVITIMWSW